MSWANQDLREGILSLFAECQEPWHAILLWDIVEICGCQKLRKRQLQIDYAATHQKEHNAYLRDWYQRNGASVRTRVYARRAAFTEEQRARHREIQKLSARRRRAAKKARHASL